MTEQTNASPGSEAEQQPLEPAPVAIDESDTMGFSGLGFGSILE
ncbi:MAG: hypothetical protein JWR80_4803 [Bradyrhizobium sp.]|nr:hypothetical protein [Bradyrhizobium sp.]